MSSSSLKPINISELLQRITMHAPVMQEVYSHIEQIKAVAGNQAISEALRQEAKIAEQFLETITHSMEENPAAAFKALSVARTALDSMEGTVAERIHNAHNIFLSHIENLPGGHEHDHHHDHVDHEGRRLLPRPENPSWLEEMKTQIKEEWVNKKGWGGKTMMIAGSTACGAIVAHASLNIKRGLLGYADPATGEKKQGSLSNLIVGTLEGAAGLFLGKRILTGNFKFTRGGQGK
ncbi:MAG: hypothetical protein U1E36_07365 [Rickettsiales bacterium]